MSLRQQTRGNLPSTAEPLQSMAAVGQRKRERKSSRYIKRGVGGNCFLIAACFCLFIRAGKKKNGRPLLVLVSIAHQRPAGSSGSVLLAQAESCDCRGQTNLPFSPSKEQWSPVPRPRRSAELHLSLSQRACVLFFSRLFLSSSSSAGSLYKVYRRVNFFDIAPPCCSRNKRKQFVPDHKYFASRETFFL